MNLVLDALALLVKAMLLFFFEAVDESLAPKLFMTFIPLADADPLEALSYFSRAGENFSISFLGCGVVL